MSQFLHDNEDDNDDTKALAIPKTAELKIHESGADNYFHRLVHKQLSCDKNLGHVDG